MPLSLPILKTPPLLVEAELDLPASTLRLRFAGNLDENADLRKVQAYCDGQKETVGSLYLDLGQVTYLNSPGVRAWIQFLGRVQSFFQGCAFERLSESFLHSASAYAEMLGFASNSLGSCEVPFFCSACARRLTHWIDAGELGTLKALKLPAVPCPQCGSAMRLDDFEKEFFKFLARKEK
ncbi:MAG: hypothetical protein NDJ90_07510 [Oligoflexia bacterium]|nr:hypothetical protein [Oligoflexia bacterium]